MYYITEPGETLADIAYEHYGHLATDMMFNHLMDLNKYSLTGPGPLEQAVLSPYQAIYLPDDFDPPATNHQLILDELNFTPFKDRQQLRQICDMDMDPNFLTSAFDVGCQIEQPPIVSSMPGSTNKREENPAEFVTDAALGLTDKTFDVREKRAEAFEEAVKRVNEKLAEYKTKPPAMRQGFAVREIKPAYQNMLSAYQRRVTFNYSKKFNIASRNRIQRKYLNNKVFSIEGYEDAQNLINVLKYSKYIGRGFILLDIISHATPVIEAARRHDGSWPRELAIQLSGFAIGFAIGVAAVILLSPVGWVTAAVGAAVLSMGGDQGMQWLTKHVWDYYHSNELKCGPGKVPATIGLQLAGSIQPSLSTLCVEAMK